MVAETRALSGDLKSMGRIFTDNQKVLVSMRGSLDGLAGALGTIQKQSSRIAALEADAQKLFAGIAEMRASARAVERLDAQAAKMDEAVKGIEERSRRAGDLDGLSGTLEEGVGAIRANSEAVAGVARRIDEVREGVEGLSAAAAAAGSALGEIATVRSLLEEARDGGGGELAGALAGVAEKVDALAGVAGGVASLQEGIDGVASALGELGRAVEGLREESGGAVRAEFAALREELAERSGGVRAAVDGLRGVAEGVADEVRAMREEAAGSAGSASAELAAVLRLSELEASVRMVAESKRGEAADIERMAAQTAAAATALGGLTGAGLPLAVRQWAVTKMIECADRWEVRFSDLLGAMRDGLGAELARGAVRVGQVRDAYGARAVDELEEMLGGGEAPPAVGESDDGGSHGRSEVLPAVGESDDGGSHGRSEVLPDEAPGDGPGGEPEGEPDVESEVAADDEGEEPGGTLTLEEAVGDDAQAGGRRAD